MFRSLTLRLLIALTLKTLTNPDGYTVFQQVWEPGIHYRKRPCEVHVDEVDALIESENDNLSPMAESLVSSPFYHYPAESKRIRPLFVIPTVPAS